MFLLSALTLGFLGSFHCIGMCGPIAILLPEKSGSKLSIILGKIYYNLGRLFTYSILGLITGLIGFSFSSNGLQSELSIFAGIAVLIYSLILIFGLQPISHTSAYGKFYSVFRKQFKKLFSKNSSLTLFLIGVMNGLLPCGFVYIALMGALSTGNPLNGMAYMAMFGLATFPAMIAVSFIGNFSGIHFRSFVKKATPVVGLLLAFILIYRAEIKKGHCCAENQPTHNSKIIFCK